MTVVLEPHAAFEARHPDEHEYALHVEANRHAAWTRAHGTEVGYIPGREFPCPGWIRIAGENDTHRELECDMCGFATTVRIRRAALPAAHTSDQKEW